MFIGGQAFNVSNIVQDSTSGERIATIEPLYDYKITNLVVDYEGWVKSKTELLLNIRDDYSQKGDELSINGKIYTIDQITVDPSINQRTATLLGNILELTENTPVNYSITNIRSSYTDAASLSATTLLLDSSDRFTKIDSHLSISGQAFNVRDIDNDPTSGARTATIEPLFQGNFDYENVSASKQKEAMYRDETHFEVDGNESLNDGWRLRITDDEIFTNDEIFTVNGEPSVLRIANLVSRDDSPKDIDTAIQNIMVGDPVAYHILEEISGNDKPSEFDVSSKQLYRVAATGVDGGVLKINHLSSNQTDDELNFVVRDVNYQQENNDLLWLQVESSEDIDEGSNNIDLITVPLQQWQSRSLFSNNPDLSWNISMVSLGRILH